MILFEAGKIVNDKKIYIDNAYLDKDRAYLPDYAGVYFVFVGKVDNLPDGGFRMKSPKLLYIGKAKETTSVIIMRMGILVMSIIMTLLK